MYWSYIQYSKQLSFSIADWSAHKIPKLNIVYGMQVKVITGNRVYYKKSSTNFTLCVTIDTQFGVCSDPHKIL